MPANQAQLIAETVVQPCSSGIHAFQSVQLCRLDLIKPTLTQRIAALFTFSGHLSATGWQQSLSAVLEKYPVCCGRLQLSGTEGAIVSSFAGVPFFEAVQADGIEDQLAALPQTAAAYTQDINAEQLLAGNEALLKVQITHCGEAQTLLGITVAQVLSDLTGLVDLLKDWMSLHQQQTAGTLPKPVFDRTKIQPVQHISRRTPVSSILHLLGLLGTYIGVAWQLLWQGAYSKYHPTVLVIPSTTLQDFKDRINSLALSGPHRLSSNDLLCSMLWHVVCLVRDRTDCAGTFHLPFDLRQMHVPDAYFGNAHCMMTVVDPERAPIDAKAVSKDDTEVSVVLTARLVRRAVIDARNEGKSAQVVSQQLKAPSPSWLTCTSASLHRTITHDINLKFILNLGSRCRNEGKSAQVVSQQLKAPSPSWLTRTSASLDRTISHDASLASWQELYRCVSALNFGTGTAVALAAVRQDGEAQPWVGWWGQNPLTGKAYLHVNVPPRAQGSFKSCHLWEMLLPGAYFA